VPDVLGLLAEDMLYNVVTVVVAVGTRVYYYTELHLLI
jgi:hypothetical protein